MLKYAIIEINGEKNKVRFKKELQIDLPAGDYDFMCYGKYMGKANKANGRLSINTGETVSVIYKTRILVFLRGKIENNKQ